MKKIASLLTVLVMTCTFLAGVIPVNAEEPQTGTDPAFENEFSVEGTNSFGNLLSDELDTVAAEQEANNGCNVFAAEVTGNEVFVEFETTQYCTLLAAVYTEDGVQMLASGTAEVTPEETEKTVTIETEEMPEYFYLKVFLVDTNTLRPICTAYESPNYTQEMQEFFAKTVDDFDAERVLNLDEDPTNNFAVFSEDTVLIQSDENTNTVTSADEELDVYIIENADESVTSLRNGDIFSLEADDGNILIVKVDEVTVDGTTAKVYGQDTDMEEVFEYVKIDASQNTEEAEIDPSNLEEGIIYNGLVEYTEDTEDTEQGSGASTYNAKSGYVSSRPRALVDEEYTKSKKASLEFFKFAVGDDAGNVSLTGEVGLELTASLKVYITFSYRFVEVGFDISAFVDISLTGEVKADLINFPSFKFPIFYGINFEVIPKLVLECSAGISAKGEIIQSATFSAESDSDSNSHSCSIDIPKPVAKLTVTAEGKLFIGFTLEPQINIVDDKIAKIGIEFAFGAEFKGEKVLAEISTAKEEEKEKHECGFCIDGDINAVLSADFEVKFANSKQLTFNRTIGETNRKIGDFYYSFSKKEHGFGTCPYYSYQVKFEAVDKNGNPLPDTNITIQNDNVDKTAVTDGFGIYDEFFKSGAYKVIAEKGGQKILKYVLVMGNPKSVKFKFNKSAEELKEEITVTTAAPVTTTTTQTTVTLTEPIEVDENLTYDKIDEDNDGIYDYIEITGCNQEATEVEIPAEIDGLPVKSIGYSAFYECTSLKSIAIPDSVTSIEDYAFYNCTSLENVTIPDSVTSIGDDAFYYCTSLTSITIPNSVTSIGDYAFSSCRSLTSITIPDSVTSIKFMAFYNCTSLENVTIPDSVTSIGDDAFSNCTSLISITIPNSVTSIGDEAFGGCRRLESITIPDSVTSIGGYAFYNTPWLEAKQAENPLVIVNNILIDGKTCSGDVVIPDGVTSIGYSAFDCCYDFESVTIPDSVTSIGDSAFSNCRSLESVSIGNSVTSIGGYAFYNTPWLEAKQAENPLVIVNNILIDGKTCSGDVVIPDGVTSIGYSAFDCCYDLESVTIPDSVTSIGDYAFSNCRSLESVSIGNSVTSIGDSAFYFCGQLTDVYYSGTEEQWNEISIGSDNSDLTAATIHFNSTGSTSTASYSALTLAADEIDNTKQFSDLLPNEIYNFYALKSNEAESMLSSDNLLYINQSVSDENGNLTVSYIPKEEYADAVFIVKAMSKTDLSSAEVTLSDMPYNGEEQFAEPVVTLDGITLEQGTDYDIEGDYSAINSGDYEITIVGTGDYTGEVTASYSITCEHEFTDGICGICGTECGHIYEDGICTECGETEDIDYVIGDANNDGKMTVSDAAFIARTLAKREIISVILNPAADYNSDGKVTVSDAAAIARELAKAKTKS
ncbi:MAG: hypothetical protein E7508_05885 [Ruminococcus sp.]|nr:hypothetical protein [Ruminococcus sp.]